MLTGKPAGPGPAVKMNGNRLNEVLIILCIEELLLVMGQGFLSPILPKFVQLLGIGADNIGLAVGAAMTAFGVARAGMDIPTGKLAKRYGRRFLLVLAPAVVTISSLGCALASEYWELIIWRLLQGASSACFGVAAIIVVGEISTPANRGLYMSFLWGTFLVGASLGPGFGGFIGEYFGIRAVFFTYAGLALMATVWGYFRIPETSSRNTAAPGAHRREQGPGSLFNSDFILITAVSLIFMITTGGTQNTLVPLVGYERLLLSEGQVGLVLTAIAVFQLILTPFAGRISDQIGRKALIVSSGMIVSLGLAMFVQSASYWLFIFSALILGLGRGIGGPIPTTYVADIAKPGNYENTLATYRAISDLGWVIGPVLCGYLKDVAGIGPPFYLTAGMFAVVSVLFGIFARETVSQRERRGMPQEIGFPGPGDNGAVRGSQNNSGLMERCIKNHPPE